MVAILGTTRQHGGDASPISLLVRKKSAWNKCTEQEVTSILLCMFQRRRQRRRRRRQKVCVDVSESVENERKKIHDSIRCAVWPQKEHGFHIIWSDGKRRTETNTKNLPAVFSWWFPSPKSSEISAVSVQIENHEYDNRKNHMCVHVYEQWRSWKHFCPFHTWWISSFCVRIVSSSSNKLCAQVEPSDSVSAVQCACCIHSEYLLESKSCSRFASSFSSVSVALFACWFEDNPESVRCYPVLSFAFKSTACEGFSIQEHFIHSWFRLWWIWRRSEITLCPKRILESLLSEMIPGKFRFRDQISLSRTLTSATFCRNEAHYMEQCARHPICSRTALGILLHSSSYWTDARSWQQKTA